MVRLNRRWFDDPDRIAWLLHLVADAADEPAQPAGQTPPHEPPPASAPTSNPVDENADAAEGFACPLCGARMYGVHCKLNCPNCGYREDCSDIFRV